MRLPPLQPLVAVLLGAGLAASPAAAAPQVVKRVEPSYPPEAARSGISGFVEVEFTVDASGKVASVSVVNAKPTRTFESAVVRAMKQWQFAPGNEGRGKTRFDFKP